MKRLLKKVLLIVVLFAPMFINTDCKKQKKCGCRGDVLGTYSYSSIVYFSDESPSITMQIAGYYYDYYTVCNPDEIRSKLEGFNSGEELVVTGNYYWDCNYVSQASNYSYSAYNTYRSYVIYVTDIFKDMYGKDDSDEILKRAQ